MRLAIVGTSNSLRKDGYTAYLAADKRVTVIDNFSIGASTGLHSIRSTAGVDFTGYDFCFIDFSVNEEVVRKNGALNLTVTREIVDSLIVRCFSGGCIPVIVLLPRLMDTAKARMRAFYLQVAMEWGIPVFDGYDLVDRIRASSDIEKFAIFLDAAHIRPWVCLLMARALVDGLAALPTMRFADRCVGAPMFATISVADNLAGATRAETVSRGSARSSGTFVRSMVPTVLPLAGVDASAAVGVCLNLSETYCIVHVSGDGDAALDVRSSYFGNPAFRLVVSALPLMQTVGVRAGCLEVRSLDATGAEALGSFSEASSELGRVKAPATGQIEIADLFVRLNGEVVSQRAPADGMHRSLLLPSSDRDIDIATGVYRSLITKEQDEQSEIDARARAREKRIRKLRARAA